MKNKVCTIYACLLVSFMFSACTTSSLSKKEAEKKANELYTQWLVEMRGEHEEMWNEKTIVGDTHWMMFDYRILGDKPADGRSLYISLHGGGNTSDEINYQQWRNQVGLYTPEEGVYIAPSTSGAWDMWFKPHIDNIFNVLIQVSVAMEDVNPDKVYLLGYSAGGDGVYRMAPRMADHWAAASMMAGHPGEASQVNLHNLPFMIWMGAEDAAYDRNRWAATIGQRLDSLQAADPTGYIHETHIIEGKGHWMDRVDAAAIPWMAQFKRNPYPEKIVWRQEDITLPYLYWLGVSRDEAQPGMRVDALREGNTITLLHNDYQTLAIYLNDTMFDLDRPIIVRYGGKEIFNSKVNRSVETLEETLLLRRDPRYIFPAKIEIHK